MEDILQFKIDLIVWKSIIIIPLILFLLMFKIDLIVWKSVRLIEENGSVYGLK